MRKLKEGLRIIQNKFKKKSFVIRIIPQSSKSVYTLNLNLSKIIIGLLLFFAFGIFIGVKASEKINMEKSRFMYLEQEKLMKEKEVARVKKEKDQISILLSKQNEELTRKLELIQKQDNEVRKIIGLKPTNVISKKIKVKGNRGSSVVELKKRFQKLEDSLNNKEKDLKNLKIQSINFRKEMQSKKIQMLMATVPSIYPTSGAIVSWFGYRMHPISGYYKMHDGLDFAAPYGTPILATASGIVCETGYMGGLGLAITIDHQNGYKTTYGHCDNVYVSNGQYVKQGQHIASVGSSGFSTGPHLHYEISKYGIKDNPIFYLNMSKHRIARILNIRAAF